MAHELLHDVGGILRDSYIYFCHGWGGCRAKNAYDHSQVCWRTSTPSPFYRTDQG
jgi:hypothetical protein